MQTSLSEIQAKTLNGEKNKVKRLRKEKVRSDYGCQPNTEAFRDLDIR